MGLLRENFLHLQIIGLWAPVSWPPGSWKSRAYRLYTAVLVTMTYWFGITESISLFFVVNTVEDFSDNSFMLLTTIIVCVKVDLILSKKSEIIALIATFEGSPHKPLNADEERIQAEFNSRIRLISCIFGTIGEVSVCIMTISVFFQEIPYGDLPYKAWIPYDYSKPVMYWFTFFLQLLAVIFLANVVIAFDTTLVGLFFLICAQFNILSDRLNKVVDNFETETMSKSGKDLSHVVQNCENKIIDCVKYHRAIFKLSERINLLYQTMTFVQYSASTVVICISLFMLSQVPALSTKALFFFLYLLCMLVQIFTLCASANEATIECKNVTTRIYNTKWYILTNQAKRYLSLVMVRTLRPVIFMSGSII
nr:odorant receptor 38 [Psyttalia incisi]